MTIPNGVRLYKHGFGLALTSVLRLLSKHVHHSEIPSQAAKCILFSLAQHRFKRWLLDSSIGRRLLFRSLIYSPVSLELSLTLSLFPFQPN